MADVPDLGLIVALGGAGGRAAAAARLAQRAGAEQLVVLVRDPELPVMLPAPGFAQTLRGGPAWHDFIGRCAAPGRHSGEVDLDGRRRPASACAQPGVAAVFLGAVQLDPALVQTLEALLPLLASVFGAELRVLGAAAEAAEARDAVSRAQALASALEAARAESVKLNAELHEEQRRKDDFLAMLGHELRNPLAPMISSLELLRRAGAAGPLAETHLAVMGRQLSQLSSLVEDLLDVSRVSRGLIELNREPLLLADAIRLAVETAQPAIQARRHRLDVDPGSEPIALDADRVRLTQVFANLLHNAAKYTDPGGSIRLCAQREGQWAVVRVSDSGIGVAPEMLPRIFDLFTQAPVAIDRAQGGLGIGLTLVRTLVALHGGRVEAASPGIGHGSTFTVRLPLAAGPGVAVTTPQTDATAATGRLRVLVVDDNEDAADSLAELLRVLGHEAEIAYGALSALQKVGSFKPDLILLDLGLPQFDGFEVARRVRRVETWGVRLVALTGYGAEEDRRRAYAAGFDEHACKPISVDQLEEILRKTAAAISDPARPSPRS